TLLGFSWPGVLAADAKIDNLLLVASEDRVHFPQKNQGQMSERGEAAISKQDVPLVQFRMHEGRMTHVMRSHRRGHHALQQARARMKQGQDVSHRKAAPFGLDG